MADMDLKTGPSAEEKGTPTGENGTRPLSGLPTLFSLGSGTTRRNFSMHEMSIGRARKFVLRIKQAYQVLQERVGGKLEDLDVDVLLSENADQLFAELTGLFNFVFEWRNDEYEPVDQEWLEDSVSFREMKEVGKAIVEQSQMGWLLPLLVKQFRQTMATALPEAT